MLKKINYLALLTTAIIITVIFSCKKSDPDAIVKPCKNPPPSANASNNSPVAPGGTIQLKADAIADASYLWSGPAGFTSKLQNPTLTYVAGQSEGEYKVVVTVGGCTSESFTYVVNKQLTAGGDTAVIFPIKPPTKAAEDKYLRIKATAVMDQNNTPFALTYYWSGPNGFTSNLQNPAIKNPPLSGTGYYKVYAMLPNGVTTNTDSIYCVVRPEAPAVTATASLKVGGTLNLTATTVSGASYSWSGPNGFTSTLQNPSITNVSKAMQGIYSVYYTVSGITSYVGSSSSVVIGYSNSGCNGDTVVTHNGITYKVVEVGGTQCWMAENMKRSATTPLTSQFYSFASMDTTSAIDNQGICPNGWHLPSETEWTTLATFANGDGNALKDTTQGTALGKGTNTTGFSALLNIGTGSSSTASFWTVSEISTDVANYVTLYNTNALIFFDTADKKKTYSVRCIKD